MKSRTIPFSRVRDQFPRVRGRNLRAQALTILLSGAAGMVFADEVGTRRDRARMHDASSVVAMPVGVDGRVPANAERKLPQAVFVLYGDSDLEPSSAAATTPAATADVPTANSTTANTTTHSAPGSTDAGIARNETQRSHFESGKGELLPHDRASLDRIASLVRGRANLHFVIVGHTDSQRISKPLRKTYPDNQALGEARARRVGAYLRDALALQDSAFDYASKGETQPLADNRTKDGMAKNRRVEVQVFWNDPVGTTPVVAALDTATSLPAPVVSVAPAAPATPRSECDALVPTTTADPDNAFALSVDGNPVVDGGTRNSADRQRCEDVALARDRLRLQYDNLAQTRKLDVSAWPVAVLYGGRVLFHGYANYRPFIDRAEVRIVQGDAGHGFESVATLPLDEKFSAEWNAPNKSSTTQSQLWYRLRVYDGKGAFDETQALPLALLDHAPVDNAGAHPEQLDAGYGENRIEVANIAVDGGTLTISGDGIAASATVSALGLSVPVDPNGRFVIQQIVPRGLATAEIAVRNTQGAMADKARIYRRDFRLPQQDWFYVGIADLTLGHNNASGPAATVTNDSRRYEGDTYTNGHLAFYVKGKLDNTTTLTAAMDTREAPISQLFDNFMRKDPRSLFRRFDAKEGWATFGDDSTRVEDAPTEGRFYARLEREQSSLMWGDFKVTQTETELAQINRGLYGADLRIAGHDSTSFGARSFRVEAFGADPGTVAAKDEYRGTGGTLYYLRNQDISLGSERLYVEVRDRDSGFVLSRRPLVTGSDYEMDYLQGRVLLSSPLSSFADESTLVRAGSLSGNPVWLVANYEFTPVNIAGNNMLFGGRISNWFGDAFRVGLTASSQRQQDISQKLGGVDLMWRKSEDTWLKLEGARSKGFAGNQSFSNDGGYFFGEQQLIGSEDQRANASRIEAQFALHDFGAGDGKFAFYGEQREAGFAGPGQLTDRDAKQGGAALEVPLGSDVKLRGKFDSRKETHGYDDRSAAADVDVQLTEQWKLGVGVRNDKREQDSVVTPLAPTTNDVAGISAVSNAPARTGTRTDAALQLGFASNEDWSAYGFGQGTVQSSGTRRDNNRAGVGGKVKLSERVTGDAEVSGGNGGFGAHAGVDYQFSDASNAYLSYRADPDRTDEGIRGRNGMLVGGARTRLSEAVSLNSEYRYQIGETSGLTQAYGVELTPFDKWTFGASAEVGKLDSELLSRIARRAIVLRANYTNKYTVGEVKYGGAIELRRDASRQDTRRSWLARNNLTWQLGTDGRVLGRLNIGRSNSSAGTIFGTDYTEAMAGYAWRPANNDRWNVLFRYTYLFDLTSPGQQDGIGSSLIDYQQRSHVLALDANYDISSRWTIGGRVAGRRGELRQSRDNSAPWFDSTATLVALRVDWKVVHDWDWLVEGRQLRATEARDHKSGALTALYYHVNGNLKVGGGYNWTSYSDELTDLSYRNRGVFLNVLGSF